ncbi:MAG: hypothetical protein Q4C95_05070 [Planctomycetia bacterium]|nr:hypothetical protein [Planctomycetia bacterium]
MNKSFFKHHSEKNVDPALSSHSFANSVPTDFLKEDLLALLYGLLDDEQAELLRNRIATDAETAKNYEEIRHFSEKLEIAAKTSANESLVILPLLMNNQLNPIPDSHIDFAALTTSLPAYIQADPIIHSNDSLSYDQKNNAHDQQENDPKDQLTSLKNDLDNIEPPNKSDRKSKNKKAIFKRRTFIKTNSSLEVEPINDRSLLSLKNDLNDNSVQKNKAGRLRLIWTLKKGIVPFFQKIRQKKMEYSILIGSIVLFIFVFGGFIGQKLQLQTRLSQDMRILVAAPSFLSERSKQVIRVNISDIQGKPKTTPVRLVFFDSETQQRLLAHTENTDYRGVLRFEIPSFFSSISHPIRLEITAGDQSQETIETLIPVVAAEQPKLLALKTSSQLKAESFLNPFEETIVEPNSSTQNAPLKNDQRSTPLLLKSNNRQNSIEYRDQEEKRTLDNDYRSKTASIEQESKKMIEDFWPTTKNRSQDEKTNLSESLSSHKDLAVLVEKEENSSQIKTAIGAGLDAFGNEVENEENKKNSTELASSLSNQRKIPESLHFRSTQSVPFVYENKESSSISAPSAPTAVWADSDFEMAAERDSVSNLSPKIAFDSSQSTLSESPNLLHSFDEAIVDADPVDSIASNEKTGEKPLLDQNHPATSGISEEREIIENSETIERSNRMRISGGFNRIEKTEKMGKSFAEESTAIASSTNLPMTSNLGSSRGLFGSSAHLNSMSSVPDSSASSLSDDSALSSSEDSCQMDESIPDQSEDSIYSSPLNESSHLNDLNSFSEIKNDFSKLSSNASRIINETEEGEQSVVPDSEPIQTVLPTVHFYPENGFWVAGIENRVWVSSIDSNGQPVQVFGQIKDNQEKIVVDSFSTNKDGLGLFSFEPQYSNNYFFAFSDSPTKEKSSISLGNIESNHPLAFQVKKVLAAEEPIQIQFFSFCRSMPIIITVEKDNVILEQLVLQTKEKMSPVEIHLDSEISGTLKINVYNGEKHPFEKLLSTFVYRRPDCSRTIESTVFHSEGKNQSEIVINVKDTKTNLSLINESVPLSLLVIDTDKVNSLTIDEDLKRSIMPDDALELLLGITQCSSSDQTQSNSETPNKKEFSLGSEPLLFDNLIDLRKKVHERLFEYRQKENYWIYGFILLGLLGGSIMILASFMFVVLRLSKRRQFILPLCFGGLCVFLCFFMLTDQTTIILSQSVAFSVNNMKSVKTNSDLLNNPPDSSLSNSIINNHFELEENQIEENETLSKSQNLKQFSNLSQNEEQGILCWNPFLLTDQNGTATVPIQYQSTIKSITIYIIATDQGGHPVFYQEAIPITTE